MSSTYENFSVFGREIPTELIEPLIEHLCKELEDASYSIYREEFLDFGLARVKSERDF